MYRVKLRWFKKLLTDNILFQNFPQNTWTLLFGELFSTKTISGSLPLAAPTEVKAGSESTCRLCCAENHPVSSLKPCSHLQFPWEAPPQPQVWRRQAETTLQLQSQLGSRLKQTQTDTSWCWVSVLHPPEFGLLYLSCLGCISRLCNRKACWLKKVEHLCSCTCFNSY